MASAASAGDELADRVASHFSRFLQTAEKAGARRESSVAPTSAITTGNAYIGDIRTMIVEEASTLPVDYYDLLQHDAELAETLVAEYYRFEPALRQALAATVEDVRAQMREEAAEGADVPEAEPDRELMVAFFNLPAAMKLRSLRSRHVGRLLSIAGTVTRTSEVRPELLYGTFLCLECGTVVPNIEQQFKYTEPARCSNESCNNRSKWRIVVAQSRFVDWQRLRVQENSDEIPAGSMPRSIDVVLRGENAERVKPGDKCIFSGSLIAVPDVAALRRPGENVQGVARGRGRRTNEAGVAPGEGVTGLKQLGVRDLTYRLAFLVSGVAQAADRVIGSDGAASVFGLGDDAKEEERDAARFAERLPRAVRDRIREMKETPSLYARMARSVAPAVCGHEELKRGVLLMLLGGVHKRTAEGINLRGDVNVCVVGDPSTAKSQFLKWTCEFLPRAVYTSGKASSAAGLTASVVKDPDTGEFAIEAGALMLADNGICCIDEFDKMDPADQVAIHEAMEQQTISITKAGIQATLNARASILAAANPVFGRYDRTKTLRQNVSLTAPIMSRFDLFFVVLDECDENVDAAIARHIVAVHRTREDGGAGGAGSAVAEADFSMDDLRSYIGLARQIDPVLTPEAQLRLIQLYKRLRANDSVGAARSAYRITVRQLESMVRLAEALARLHLSSRVVAEYVDEAYRLLRKSIIHVETGDEVELPNLAPLPSILRPRKPQGAPAPAEGDAEGGEGDAGDADGAGAEEGQPTAKEAPAQATQVTFDEYQRVSTKLALRILQEERERGAGVRQGAVIDWHLGQEGLRSEEELAAARARVQSIMRRLRTVDRVLLEGSDAPLEPPDSEDDLVVTVHPHFGV